MMTVTAAGDVDDDVRLLMTMLFVSQTAEGAETSRAGEECGEEGAPEAGAETALARR